MKDRVPGAPGQYKAVISEAELQKMQAGEQFVITMTRDDQPIVEGTPYSKAAVLPDDVATLICPDVEDPTPADALHALYDINKASGEELKKKAEYVLLWRNASKTSSFAAQTITADARGYSYLMIVCGYGTSTKNGADAILVRVRPDGDGVTEVGLTVNFVSSTNGLVKPFRKLEISDYKNSFVFGAGHKGDGTENNDYCIPYYIYGIKGVNDP